MKTIDNNVAIDFYLHKVLPQKHKRLLWLKTYNLLLDGKCPEELRETEDGQLKVLEVLKGMAGWTRE